MDLPGPNVSNLMEEFIVQWVIYDLTHMTRENLSWGGLQTTKAQTSLISAFVICFLESISKLATGDISMFKLVFVFEDIGLSLPLPETLKTGFVAFRPICDKCHNSCNGSTTFWQACEIDYSSHW